MSEYIQNNFCALTFFNAAVGICIPGLPKQYSKYEKYFFFYCILITLLNVSQVISCTIMITIYYNDSKNYIHTTSILALMASCLASNTYITCKRKKLMNIVVQLNKLIDEVLSDQLMERETFKRKLYKYYRPIGLMITVTCISMCAMAVSNNISKLLRRFHVFNADGEKLINFEVPYETNYSPMYEITIVIQTIDLTIRTSQQTCMHSLFVAFFSIVITFYHLLQQVMMHLVAIENIRCKTKANCKNSITMNEGSRTVFANNDSDHTNDILINPYNEIFFKKWIKLHQEIISISKELIRLYSPLLGLYFVYIYISVAFTMFSAVQNTHFHTAIELIVLAWFSGLTIFGAFFMCCSYGNLIMVESGKVAWAVYASPWYKSTYQIKTLIKMALLRAQMPIIVNCFSSTSFDLTNATFIVMVKSIVSFYFGLVSMRKQ